MKRDFQRGLLTCAILWIAAMASAYAQAGQTASSTLVISMQVQSTLSLVFVNQGSGVGYCQLSGTNTNAAALDFGIASVAGDNQTCVNFSTAGSGGNQTYTVASNVYLEVTATNTSSTSFSLTGALGSAPPANVTWTIAAMPTPPLSTTAATITSSTSYGTPYDMYLSVTVKKSVAAGNLSNIINFVATAN
jgi:hypothetical protein